MQSINAGLGIVAKGEQGDSSDYISMLKHIIASDPENSPWISTTSDLEVALRYDSGHGIVAIDLSKVDSVVINAATQIPNEDFVHEMAIELAERDREFLVFMQIPQSAIVGYYYE